MTVAHRSPLTVSGGLNFMCPSRRYAARSGSNVVGQKNSQMSVKTREELGEKKNKLKKKERIDIPPERQTPRTVASRYVTKITEGPYLSLIRRSAMYDLLYVRVQRARSHT